MIVTCAKCNTHVDTGDAAPGDIVTCRCGLGIMVPEGPAAAGKMGCPSCGAPVDPQKKVCEFCDTRLATVMCPTCFGVVFDGAKHCSHCGAALSAGLVIHHGDETAHLCPRCPDEQHLRVEVVAGCPLERCDICEGMWVDEQTVERLYKDRHNAPTIQAMTGAKQNVSQADGNRVRPEGYIKCPACQKMMNRKNFGRFSGVIIDTCKGHGTWFDADELRRIVEFIQAGGLEKQAEREREELKEELRRLRAKARGEQAKAARDGSMGMGAGLGAGDRILGGTSALAIGGILRKIF